MRVYHVTEYANADSILKTGLQTDLFTEKRVYVTRDWKDLLDVDVEQRGEDLAIFLIEIDESELIPDPEFDQDEDDLWVWYVENDIHPSQIELIDRVRCIPHGTGVHVESIL